MTVVDVNTGKFTGSGGNLEETVTKNNLEAAEEIVRQLRLRDIGGIIVIDFIDMVLELNRDLVLRRLVECLGRDRTKHQVAEVTSLGLVQMTRKRIGTGLLEAFSENCDHCGGRGLILHDEPKEPKKRARQWRAWPPGNRHQELPQRSWQGPRPGQAGRGRGAARGVGRRRPAARRDRRGHRRGQRRGQRRGPERGHRRGQGRGQEHGQGRHRERCNRIVTRVTTAPTPPSWRSPRFDPLVTRAVLLTFGARLACLLCVGSACASVGTPQ